MKKQAFGVFLFVLSLLVILTGCEKNDDTTAAFYLHPTEAQVLARVDQHMQLVKDIGEYERQQEKMLAKCREIDADYAYADEMPNIDSEELEWHCGYSFTMMGIGDGGQALGYEETMGWDSLPELQAGRLSPMRLQYIN